MKTFFYILLYSLCFTSCKKFFDQKPDTTLVNPQTIADFDEMLSSDSLATCNFFLADLMSDDVRLSDGVLQLDTAFFLARSYRWATNIWNPGDADFMYSSTYKRILQMNIILDKVSQIQGNVVESERISAEAKINRAWYYLQLASLYGKEYRAQTAATDLGVPLTLRPNANELPERASVQQIFDQIIQDLSSAVSSSALPAQGVNIKHPGKAAGYALLARTYLYMGDFKQAEIAADSALSLHNTLMDYNATYNQPARLNDLTSNPEVLLGRICIDYSFFGKYATSFFIDPELDSLLGINDTRKAKKFNADGIFKLQNYIALVFDYSLGVPEVLLVKAECLARRQENTAAVDILNQLRQKRLVNYEPLENSANVLVEVLQERRRELFYRGGLRLFDLKRLNQDNNFSKTLVRISEDSMVLATLPPSSPRYLMEFSPTIIANNPNITQNPR